MYGVCIIVIKKSNSDEGLLYFTMYNSPTCDFGLLLLHFNHYNTYKCKKLLNS